MKNKFSILMLLGAVVLYLTSCYNNKKDIETLPKVSFANEVVPILTSGPCGCHNNGASQRAVQWSNLYKQNHGLDTVKYDVILARTGALKTWVNGGAHPGGGAIEFTAYEAKVIRDWINQGAEDDSNASSAIPTNVTYAANISGLVSTTCNGGACHGGLGPVLSYTKLVATKTTLQNMISSKGSGSSHPGGVLSLSSSTWSLLNAWIQQGMN